MGGGRERGEDGCRQDEEREEARSDSGNQSRCKKKISDSLVSLADTPQT